MTSVSKKRKALNRKKGRGISDYWGLKSIFKAKRIAMYNSSTRSKNKEEGRCQIKSTQ